MYLSRIILDKARIPLQELSTLFSHGHPAHALAWQVFSRGEDDTRQFLFREDHSVQDFILWAVSYHKPDNWNNYLKIESSAYAPMLHVGTRLGFKLRANATVCVKTSKEKRGVHHDVVMHAKHLARGGGEEPGGKGVSQAELVQREGTRWLARQGARHGFELAREQVIVDAYTSHRFRKAPGSRAEVQFHTLDFEGQLRVTDPEAFVNMLYSGLGRTKAYGNGMMLVRKIPV